MELRCGLIGCGGIGELRAQAVARLPSHRLVAVSDAIGSRAAAMAATYRCQAEAEWRALVRRRDVDAVIVSTPPSLHAEMTIEALENGKHVLCEKPLARTLEECSLMNRAAERSGRLLATGFNYRFYPSMLKARELLDAGTIGELNHVRSYAGYTAKDHNHEWLHDVEVMGGGALRDNGIHLLDLTRYFMGEVAEVKGYASNAVWKFRGCEDNGFGLLRSPTGVIGTVQASWTEWRGYQFLVELYGTRGCIRAWCFPTLVRLIHSNQVGGSSKKKTYCFPKVFLFEHLRSYRWVVVQSFVEELAAFGAAIGGGSTHLATGLDGLETIRIAEAICRDGL
jgi:predicted dehydrogenase